MVKGLHAPREGSFREQVLDLNKNTLHYVALVFFLFFLISLCLSILAPLCQTGLAF